MASLQSPRTQCCCCAVGVFAAMFGIFMLSAGICIVLNVTFMEVDTSGLPPELHNEEGKKVVGIILICVSIATLGLSASVSVIYFVVCSRKPRSPAPSNPSTQPAPQPKPTSAHQVTTPDNRTSRSVTPVGGRIRRSSGHHTPSTDRQQRRELSTVDGAVGRSMSPQPSVRNAHPNMTVPRHSRSRLKSPKTHKLHRRGFRPGLPSHKEEDLEAAKSVNDFQMQQQSPESSSNSGTSTSPSGRGIRAIEDRFKGSHRNSSMPPVIVIDDTSLPMSTSNSENDLAETQFVDYGSASGQFKLDPDVGHGYGPSTSDSVTFVTEINNYVGDLIPPDYILRSTSQEDLDMATPPSLPYNIDVVGDDGLRVFNSPPSSPTPIHPQLKHGVLLVQSLDTADQITPWSSTNTLDMAEFVQEENDHISDLPSQHFQSTAAVGQHEPSNWPSRCTDDHNSRSESRASYNSAFSVNGEELDKTMEEVKRRIEEMQKD